jgi:hypothetical protein
LADVAGTLMVMCMIQSCHCEEGAFPDEAISSKQAYPESREIASPPKSTSGGSQRHIILI